MSNDRLVCKGAELRPHYKHYMDPNDCIAGEGGVENTETAEVHLLSPRAVQVLGKRDWQVAEIRSVLQ